MLLYGRSVWVIKKKNNLLHTQKIKIPILTGLITGLFLTFFISCNNAFVHRYRKGQTDLPSQDIITQSLGNNGDLKIIPGTRTIGVTHFGQVLPNMLSITGLQSPSTTTRDTFNLKKSSFSETGRATSLNAPIVMAYVSVGAEVCNDVISQEKKITADQRRLFPKVNFTAGLNSFSADIQEDTVNRLARSFWGRNETTEESALLHEALTEAFGEGTDNQAKDTEAAVLYLCTVMIASLDAITM